jgi:glycosyltransferase involved in cell wall biosynthesis
MLISVVTPTRHRPLPLRRALASLAAQVMPVGVEAEIVVVDNSADGETAQALADEGGLKVVHEPRPGVAQARNAGLAAARGEWIAFLDDDEEAGPGWLAALTKVAAESGADAVFGPISARAEERDDIGPFAPYFSRALGMADGADITRLSAYLGTNNSMFHRQRCLNGAATFDVSLNECGGEDSLLIERLRRSGKRFAYAARADVVEWAPARRLDWDYVTKRKFLSGQIRVFVQRMAAPHRWDRVALWMAVGAAQFLAAGAAALALAPVARARAQRWRAIAFGGLGKLFWQRGFRPALYGAGHVS